MSQQRDGATPASLRPHLCTLTPSTLWWPRFLVPSCPGPPAPVLCPLTCPSECLTPLSWSDMCHEPPDMTTLWDVLSGAVSFWNPIFQVLQLHPHILLVHSAQPSSQAGSGRNDPPPRTSRLCLEPPLPGSLLWLLLPPLLAPWTLIVAVQRFPGE